METTKLVIRYDKSRQVSRVQQYTETGDFKKQFFILLLLNLCFGVAHVARAWRIEPTPWKTVNIQDLDGAYAQVRMNHTYYLLASGTYKFTSPTGGFSYECDAEWSRFGPAGEWKEDVNGDDALFDLLVDISSIVLVPSVHWRGYDPVFYPICTVECFGSYSQHEYSPHHNYWTTFRREGPDYEYYNLGFKPNLVDFVGMTESDLKVEIHRKQYSLNVSSSSGGSVLPAGGWYNEGGWVNLSATPDPGYRFVRWDGPVVNPLKETTIIVMKNDHTVKANFEPKNTEVPFRRGVNLSTWFEAASARHIHFAKFGEQDLIDIKSLGCDVIRLPISLHNMTSGAPDYRIDPLLYDYLDQVVDWAEELELHLILDNHAYGEPTDPGIVDILVPIWTQMAQHYHNRSNLIYYEVMNEPYGISNEQWGEIQKEVIDAIRGVDQKHMIIVGPTQWNSYDNLKYMPVYSDDNLIYTFHFYRPRVFTHQGVFSDSFESLSGIPFPYDASRMPERPPEFVAGTWEWDRWENYPHEGTIEHVKELIDTAVDFQKTRNVPLLCGEFGVYIRTSKNEDRVNWYGVVRSYLEVNGIAWTMWDYKGPFHLFEKGSPRMFNHDLNAPLIAALGLILLPQEEFVLMPDENGFDIYRDHVAPGIIENWWISEGATLDGYEEDNPASGYFCIHWTGAEQYHPIPFEFSPIRDLSLLAMGNFALDLWVRCSDPDNTSVKIDLRFVDTKTNDPDDHPWRMRCTLDPSDPVFGVTWNDEWHHVQPIPLSDFTEHGASDDGWYNPIGDFDWSAIERFEIAPEYSDLNGIHFYFDDIRIVEND